MCCEQFDSHHMSKKMYSIVVPCYKSSQTIEKLVELTTAEMKKMGCDNIEFVLVNDCSPDDGETIEVLKKLAAKNKNIKVVNLGKNAGQHNAMMAGLRYAEGDTIISMDDDLQTHPSQLPKMFAAYEEGYDVVYGYYPEKKHSLFRNFGSWFNRFSVSVLLGKPKDVISSSFWIMRKYVRDNIIQYQGSHTYLLGLILRATSNIKSVPVKHFEREYGQSGYNLKALIKLWSNIIGFSSKPLQLAMYIGNIMAIGAVMFGITIIIRKVIDPTLSVGWPSIMVAILFGTGINLFFLGLLGEYVGRVYLHLNREPQYVIKDVINVEKEK